MNQVRQVDPRNARLAIVDPASVTPPNAGPAVADPAGKGRPPTAASGAAAGRPGPLDPPRGGAPRMSGAAPIAAAADGGSFSAVNDASADMRGPTASGSMRLERDDTPDALRPAAVHAERGDSDAVAPGRASNPGGPAGRGWPGLSLSWRIGLLVVATAACTLGSLLLVPGADVDAAMSWRAFGWRMPVALAAVLAGAFTCAILIGRSVTHPLARVAAAARRIADDPETGPRGRHPVLPVPQGAAPEVADLSRALSDMCRALSERLATNEMFASDVAHEIRNPLASLRSAAGSLRCVTMPAQRARLLDIVDHDLRRLDRLVADISTASRLDGDMVRERKARFDLGATLTTLADHLGPGIRSKGITFTVALPDSPITMLGLESRLAQVFVNLLANAVSFSREGDAIRLWARRQDRRVIVVVEDTGPGVPPQILSKIFDRFFSERPGGPFGDNSGLGLAISKQIVEAHGGVIWAENIEPAAADLTSLSCGARFIVGLPT